MTKKKDNLCFDISSLEDEQKVILAKSFKKTVDDFNEKLTEPQEDSEE